MILNVNIKQAFEVEDISTRENFTFVHSPEDNSTLAYNTSRGSGNVIIPELCFSGKFPWDMTDSKDYFRRLYQQAIGIVESKYPIHFIGWVDPETLQPIEEEG